MLHDSWFFDFRRERYFYDYDKLHFISIIPKYQVFFSYINIVMSCGLRNASTVNYTFHVSTMSWFSNINWSFISLGNKSSPSWNEEKLMIYHLNKFLPYKTNILWFSNEKWSEQFKEFKYRNQIFSSHYIQPCSKIIW